MFELAFDKTKYGKAISIVLSISIDALLKAFLTVFQRARGEKAVHVKYVSLNDYRPQAQ